MDQKVYENLSNFTRSFMFYRVKPVWCSKCYLHDSTKKNWEPTFCATKNQFQQNEKFSITYLQCVDVCVYETYLSMIVLIHIEKNKLLTVYSRNIIALQTRKKILLSIYELKLAVVYTGQMS